MAHQSTEDIFERRKQDRKRAGKASIEQKLQTLVKLQKLKYVAKASAGKAASRPWNSENNRSGSSKLAGN